jgi:hypothetical protein
MEVSGQLHVPVALRRGFHLRSHWIGDWMGPRAGLDLIEKTKIMPLPVIESSLVRRYTD